MKSTFCAAVFLLAMAVEVRADLVNAIEAIVDEAVITYYQVSVRNELTYEELLRHYRTEPDTLQKEAAKMRGENLDKLIQDQLILREFKSAGYSLPDSVVDDMVRERIRTQFGDRARMAKTLAEQGITSEKYRKQLKDRFIIEALRAKNISSEIIISPHKVEAYYLAHKEDYKVEDEVKLRVILLTPSDETNAPEPAKLGEEILGRLKGGASFVEMATIYSQGAQRNQGGDWGWRELSKLTMGLAEVARELPVGQPSELYSRSVGDDYWVYQYDENGQPKVGRHYGVDPDTKKQSRVEERKFAEVTVITNLPAPTEFFLMYVENKRPGHYKPLSEVREDIQATLKTEEKDRLEKQWIDRLRKKTFVRRMLGNG